MTNISQKIVFFGTEDFSLAALTGLIEAGYTIAAVVTKPDSKKGRGQKLAPPSVKVLADKHHIPVWQPRSLIEIEADIRALGLPTGVLVSYGKIIPERIISLFSPGIINVHPSLLPKYRGPSPIESAIIHGDNETGVTIMQLSARMDAGPIYTAKPYPLLGNETQPELYEALGRLGTELLVESLPEIIHGTLAPVPQHEDEATYCQLLQKADAWLNPSLITAREAERVVRAHLSFPKTKITYNDHTIIITKARAVSIQKTPLDILCRDGAFLGVEELIAPSGRRMSTADFLRGYAA